MKQIQLSLLTTAAVAVILLAGCKDDINSKQMSQAQKDEAPATQQATEDSKKTADGTTVAVSDAAITAKVKAAIFLEPALKSLNITVDTTGGIVTLSGTIDTPEKQERALQIAQNVDGVKTVNNQLSVKSAG
jgi:hyperosmotically inducible protein